MKPFRSTGLLFLFVAVLVGYTFYEFKNEDRDAALARGEANAFDFKREDIQSIKAKLKGGDIELVRRGDVWQMVKPVDDLGESTLIEGFLVSLLAQKLKDFQNPSESQNVKMADYGLENPPVQIELATKDRRESLFVSDKTAFDGSYYVKKDDRVLLGNAAFDQIGTRAPFSFRSRKLWREPEATEIQKVSVELAVDNKKTRFNLVKKDKSWSIDPKPEFVIDDERIKDWLDQLKSILPNEFAKENVDEPSKKQYQLNDPSLIVVMDFKRPDGTTGQWTLTVGQDQADKVYLFTSDRPTIYETAKETLAKLRVTPAYFHDGRKPFKVNLEQAKEIDIRTDKWKHVFVKDGQKWSLKGDDKDVEFDENKLVELTQSIYGLDAQEFLPGKTEKTEPRFIVRDGKGSEIFRLGWGNEYEPIQAWNKGTKFRYVQSSLSKDIMGLPKEKLDQLIDAGIVKKKSDKKTATELETK